MTLGSILNILKVVVIEGDKQLYILIVISHHNSKFFYFLTAALLENKEVTCGKKIFGTVLEKGNKKISIPNFVNCCNYDMNFVYQVDQLQINYERGVRER